MSHHPKHKDVVEGYSRQVADLVAQLKAKDTLIIEHLAELRAKASTIAQLESSARENRKTIDRMDKEADLYETIIEGLKAEVQLRNMERKNERDSNLGPLMMGMLGGAAGVFLGNLATKPKDKT